MSRVSIINGFDKMLTTHNNATADNNPVRAGRQVGSLARVTDYHLFFLRIHHNNRDGNNNANSGQEGDGEDKPISAHEPTKFSRGYSLRSGREDGE